MLKISSHFWRYRGFSIRKKEIPNGSPRGGAYIKKFFVGDECFDNLVKAREYIDALAK